VFHVRTEIGGFPAWFSSFLTMFLSSLIAVMVKLCCVLIIKDVKLN